MVPLLQRLWLRFFQILDPEMDQEARAYVIDWQRQMLRRATLSLPKLAIPISVMASLLIGSLAPEPPRTTNVTIFIAIGLLSGLWLLIRDRSKIDGRWMLFVVQVILGVGINVGAAQAFAVRDTATDIVILTIYSVCIGIFNVVLYPWWNSGVVFVAAAHITGLTVALSQISMIQMLDVVVIVSFVMAVAVSIFLERAKQMCRESLAEYEARKLLVQNAELKRAAVEKELELAREIQDSFDSPERFIHAGFDVSLFQRKAHFLGGDWISSRRLPNGELILIVIDATGKGIGAALVVHAVQSLWALSLNAPTFDPDIWIESVNRTLLAMGRRTTQTVSLGLLIIRGSHLKFYSAGLPPLFLLAKRDGRRVVETLMGQGDILGLTDMINIKHREVDLAAEQMESILMGTDGVFPRGGLTRGKDIERLLEQVKIRGADALKSHSEPDDKILVVMHRVA